MKKLWIISGSVFVGLIALIIVLTVTDKKVETTSYAQVEQMMEDRETFILVFGSHSCSTCNAYRAGTLKQYLKREKDYIPLIFVDINLSFERGELADFLSKHQFPQIPGTPTTTLVINGVPQSQIMAKNATIDELMEFIDPAL